MMEKLRVVTFGGGSGHSQVLKGLKTIPGLTITAICPSTDSGGSTGILRQSYGAAGYLGDLTKCAAALSADELLAAALMHRFDDGPLKNHSVKNLLFLSMVQRAGLSQALRLLHGVCGLNGHRVLPVVAEQVELCAVLKNGHRIRGEAEIDKIASNPLWHAEQHAIEDIYLDRPVSALPMVAEAIGQADWCVLTPGDLYTSVLPVFLPEGMQAAMAETPARVLVIVNITNKHGETQGYGVTDFIRQIELKIGLNADVVLCNSTRLPDELAQRYQFEQKTPIFCDASADYRYRTAPLAMVTHEGYVYHDPVLVARELGEIFSRQTQEVA